VSNNNHWLLEMRLFKVVPGTRTEFDRISREGTIPLMRRHGITVIAYGPSVDDDDSYFLLRAFASKEQRAEQSESLYATAEWMENYDGPVMAMIDSYQTAVTPANRHVVQQLTDGLGIAA